MPTGYNSELSARRRAALKHDFEKGVKTAILKRKYDRSSSSICRLAHQYGWKRPDKFPVHYKLELPADQLALLRRDFEGGVKTLVLERTYDRTSGRISVLARKHGWKRPAKFLERRQMMARFDPTPEQAVVFRELWDANRPVGEIAERFWLSRNTIRRAAARLGYPPRKQGDVIRAYHDTAPETLYRRARADRAAKLYNAGLDGEEVAAVDGRTKQGIYAAIRRVRKRGIDVRRKGSPLVIGDRDAFILRAGYRLGLSRHTLMMLMGKGWTEMRVFYAARRLGLRHRNWRNPILARLAPEQFVHWQRRGEDPVDRVQKSWRRHPSFKVRDALAALDGLAEAIELFPELMTNTSIKPRGLKPTPFKRDPSPLIEARKTTHELELAA